MRIEVENIEVVGVPSGVCSPGCGEQDVVTARTVAALSDWN